MTATDLCESRIDSLTTWNNICRTQVFWMHSIVVQGHAEFDVFIANEYPLAGVIFCISPSYHLMYTISVDICG
jgi:hypothetical protein